MEFRSGGEWHLTLHGPDGRDYQNRIIYVDIQKPSCLVYRHAPDKDTEPASFEVTILFEEDEPGTTRASVRMLFETSDARNEVVRKYKAVEGLSQTLGRLGQYLTSSSKR